MIERTSEDGLRAHTQGARKERSTTSLDSSTPFEAGLSSAIWWFSPSRRLERLPLVVSLVNTNSGTIPIPKGDTSDQSNGLGVTFHERRSILICSIPWVHS